MSDLSYKTIFKYAHNAMADLQHFLSLRAPACIEFKIQNVAGKGGFSFLKFVSGLTPIPMRCFENCTKSRKTWLKLVFQVSLECNSVRLLLGKDNRNRIIKLAFDFLIFCTVATGPTCYNHVVKCVVVCVFVTNEICYLNTNTNTNDTDILYIFYDIEYEVGKGRELIETQI